MKKDERVQTNIANKRWRRKLKSKLKKKRKRQKYVTELDFLKSSGIDKLNRENLLIKWLPPNLKYIMFDCSRTNLFYERLKTCVKNPTGVFLVPSNFSIVENAEPSYKFIQDLMVGLIFQPTKEIKIDYSVCKELDLSTQVYLDILLGDVIKFYKKCSKYKVTCPNVSKISGVNVVNEDVRKLLFSVGSPVIHRNQSIKFKDIEPYKLCVHNREVNGDPVKIREQKDIDTTKLVEYVLKSLKRLNKSLHSLALEDLSTVIGEILINAEEHSSTSYRFSIGYFHEIENEGDHFGVFRLTIMNFGDTIYQKFKSPYCKNKKVVERMKDLSRSYTKRSFFKRNQFEEETLWTLYALQDGVTSVDPQEYKRRGNGSIQFIQSFFNIKGGADKDSISKMAILSGNTSIIFDGTYQISRKTIDTHSYQMMTFNESGKIEDPPDQNYVRHSKDYFPGTVIAAKILFNDDDFN